MACFTGRVDQLRRLATWMDSHNDLAELDSLPGARTATRSRCRLRRITEGPVLSKVSTGTRTLARPLHPESVNDLLQAAVARAGLGGGPCTAHSLRARFVSYACAAPSTGR